ncbi:NXPE family member 3-like [Engraulis encrasicolus]|uniref:NXPE family member 3-like n=1 Tax=Engraulis encrasicolus TaxID=184585 RepID=UPI002FCF989E
MKSHRQWIKHFRLLRRSPVLAISSLLLLYFVVLWTYYSGEVRGGARPPSPRIQHLNRTQHPAWSPQAPPAVSEHEWQKVMKITKWAVPEHQVTLVNKSTSPGDSTFTIQNFKQNYSVGEELLVTIFAKDFTGQPKHYGGDFFQAKVHSYTLKASVFGEVVDHQNGTYSVRFILPWAGEAFVAVLLVHSSEIILALKQHWNTDTDQVYYTGFFVSKTSKNGTQVEQTEETICNIKWPGVFPGGTDYMARKNCCCEYGDAHTGLMWQCLRPRTLPCDALMYHGGNKDSDHFTPLEKNLTERNQFLWLNGDNRQINIMSTNATVGMLLLLHINTPDRGERRTCKAGLPTPVPAGFYFNDVWTSFVCATSHFQGNDSAACLKDKHIHIIGDSTIHQWFDYLVKTMPTLKSMNLHSVGQVGPHMAVDVENNIDIHWRTHGLPYRSPKAKMSSFQYIEKLIDEMDGGPQTVLVFTMWAHYTSFPLSYFVHRVSLVHRAVASLLRRAPLTKIIIKSANTAYMIKYRSDWLFFMLDRVVREAFRDMDVYFLDVWQMTSCHYLPYDLHPEEVIIKNEVDILLSFICPK